MQEMKITAETYYEEVTNDFSIIYVFCHYVIIIIIIIMS